MGTTSLRFLPRSARVGAALITIGLGAACQGGSGAGGTAAPGPSSSGADIDPIATGGQGRILESDASVQSDVAPKEVSIAGDSSAAPTYNLDIGTSCTITGACPAGTKCLGISTESPYAFCSATCGSDKDCPETFECAKYGKDQYCQRRDFCTSCTADSQCGAGARCVTMGSAKFCSRTCTLGKTECPRYANCQEVQEGGTACVHTSGSCAGDGSLCASCAAVDNCESGGACLTFNYTKEQFCATPCGSGGTCPSGYSCAAITIGAGKVNECVPSDKTKPKCVSKLFAHMEEGDVLDEFQMTGYLDTDSDSSLTTLSTGAPEEPRVIKFSEYADLGYKIVLFNVAAGWCGPCQQETTTFKGLAAKYPDLGIYQVLYDGVQQGSLPTLKLAKSWITQLKVTGTMAVGVDPDRNVAPINTGGSTPLNVIVDAKTRKILKKINGVPQSGIASLVIPYLK